MNQSENAKISDINSSDQNDNIIDKLKASNEHYLERLKKIEEDFEEEEKKSNFDDDLQNYGSNYYWEERYIICPEPYDWYASWNQIENSLSSLFNGNELVLNVGCGNSPMSEEMQNTTFDIIVNIDISSIVIEQMKEKYKNNPDLIWFEMDCTAMDFDNEMFDVVFDKGTFDALMCKNDENHAVHQTMKEICRVLKQGGLFIEITYGKPYNRLNVFREIDLSWKIYDPISITDTNDSSQVTYIYVFQKMEDNVREYIDNFDSDSN